MAEYPPDIPLGSALVSMLRRPLLLLEEWNWKAALFSAILRGVIIFLANMHAGRPSALKAMLVETVYGTVAAGCAGAITQRLRHAVPRAATAAVVWLALPLLMLVFQGAVHFWMATPRLKSSLIAGFIFSAFATGFNWFAMSRGIFVTGADRSFLRDLALVPRLIASFLYQPVRRAMEFYAERG